MGDINSKYDINEQPIIIVKNNIIVKVNKLLLDLIEYKIEEILNKNIEDLFNILRIGPSLDTENIEEKADYFLFTKLLEVKLIDIEIIKNLEEQTYIIREKPNSKFEDKFNYLYAVLTENLSGVSIYSALEGILLKANQMYLDFFDKPYNTPENTYGKKIDEAYLELENSEIKFLWREAVATGRPQYLKEYRFDKFARGITYWDITITPLKENGVIKFIVANIQEVTEKVISRKKIQEQMDEIKLKNKQMESVFENMNDPIVIYDKTRSVIYTNFEARKLYPHVKIGSKPEGLYSNIQCFDMENNPVHFENLPVNRVFNGEKIRNERYSGKLAGKTFFIEVNAVPIFDVKNNLVLAVVSHRDISKKVEYEEKINKQNELLTNVMNNIRENMIVFDRRGDVLFADKISKEIVHNAISRTKYYYDSFNIHNFAGKKLLFEDAFIFRIMRGETINDEITYYDLNGVRRYNMTWGKPVFNNSGNFLYGFYCLNNITELINNKQLLGETQEQLLKLEREKNESLEKALEMKDDFLSLISHEFRTPLNVVISAIQTLNLIYAHEMTDKVKEYLWIVKQNTNRQLRLVNNLLDITRANAGSIKVHKKNIDIIFLTKVIVESVYEFSSQKGVNITFMSSFTEKIIAIDDEKYERIILNLLSNAIKFTPKGKDITVSIYSVDENLCIDVKDNGIGIPQDKLDIIFDRFGQVDSLLSRQAEGSGIGLSLVKKLVEALEGRIYVKSKVGKGSTFTILLPDERVIEEQSKELVDLDNHLVQTINIEFSDIYL